MPKIINEKKIFEAVLQVVSERGYSAATTKQMADVAEISEVTLFRRYETKAQLVKQAISYIIEKGGFSSAATYSGDVYADLTRVVENYQNTAVQHGVFIFSLFADISRYPELINAMEEPFSIFQSIGALIARYQDEGVLKREHPMHAVATLLGPLMYIAIVQREKLDKNVPPIDFFEHVAHFLAGRCLDQSVRDR